MALQPYSVMCVAPRSRAADAYKPDALTAVSDVRLYASIASWACHVWLYHETIDKPCIAVLPFQNMSGDPEQDYFVDGMVEEITTALSNPLCARF